MLALNQWNEQSPLLSFSIDVEWAHPAVLDDVVRLFDERKIPATFFCTHAGIRLDGHERALHPNFRRNGNSIFPNGAAADDLAHYRSVVSAFKQFAPEAVGVRAHDLFYDSQLLPIYADHGLEYESSYMLPLASGLRPYDKDSGIVALPVYYMDHWDLRERASDLRLEALELDRPGLKILDFHPNLIYLNARSLDDYIESKPWYHDPDELLRRRHPGPGIRDLFERALDFAAGKRIPTCTLAEVNRAWKSRQPRPEAGQ